VEYLRIYRPDGEEDVKNYTQKLPEISEIVQKHFGKIMPGTLCLKI
jgi:hypothetical protein